MYYVFYYCFSEILFAEPSNVVSEDNCINIRLALKELFTPDAACEKGCKKVTTPARVNFCELIRKSGRQFFNPRIPAFTGKNEAAYNARVQCFASNFLPSTIRDKYFVDCGGVNVQVIDMEECKNYHAIFFTVNVYVPSHCMCGSSDQGCAPEQKKM